VLYPLLARELPSRPGEFRALIIKIAIAVAVRFCYSETGGRVQGDMRQHEPRRLRRDPDTPDLEPVIDRPHYSASHPARRRRYRLAPGCRRRWIGGRPSSRRPSPVEQQKHQHRHRQQQQQQHQHQHQQRRCPFLPWGGGWTNANEQNERMNDREDDGTVRETDISIVEECSIAGGSTMNKRKKKYARLWERSRSETMGDRGPPGVRDEIEFE